MGLEDVRKKKLLYHLTKVCNMEAIINYGLLPRRYLLKQNIRFGDVADPKIITKREDLGLDKYTPFHFHPYSAFDVVGLISEQRNYRAAPICRYSAQVVLKEGNYDTVCEGKYV